MRNIISIILFALLAFNSIWALDLNDAQTLGFKKLVKIKKRILFGRKKCIKALKILTKFGKKLGKRKMLRIKNFLKKCKKFKKIGRKLKRRSQNHGRKFKNIKSGRWPKKKFIKKFKKRN